MIINNDNIRFLNTVYNAAFKRGLEGGAADVEALLRRRCLSPRKNLYAWLGQFPKLREWVGDRQVLSLMNNGYEIENKPFELTVKVPRVDIEDDEYGVYSPLMEQMGYAANYFPDEELFGLLTTVSRRNVSTGSRSSTRTIRSALPARPA